MFRVWTQRTATMTKSAKPLVTKPVEVNANKQENGVQETTEASRSISPTGVEVESSTASAEEAVTTTSNIELAADRPAEAKHPSPPPNRFSHRSVAFFYGRKNAVTHEQDASERQKAGEAAKHASMSFFARSADRRAHNNALAVQRLIVGPASINPTSAKALPVSRRQLTKIKSELMQPKSANRLIAKLRELPMPDGPALSGDADAAPVVAKTNGPIHAVCLESTEAEVHAKHFSKLGTASIASASFEALTSLFSELHVVDLLSAPDLGLGQPGDGAGLLAGAVPTAETVIEGAVKLTPQLMSLGYATGKAVFPDHTNMHPPVDRMSVITYWWGLELCMPPPTVAHLDSAENVGHEIVNFLTALSVMNEGVREIVPFVRYISQFVDFEFNSIKKQDKGKGVVCAATWIMPAAMVPRTWDFPDPPPAGHEKKDETDVVEAPHTQGVVEEVPALDGTPPSLVATRPSVIKTDAVPENPEK